MEHIKHLFGWLVINIQHLEHFFIASIFAVINALIRPAKDSFIFYVTEFGISVSVAILVGYIVTDMGLSQSLSYAIVAISALLARDILSLIVGFGDYVTEHRESLYKRLLTKLADKLSNNKTP